MVNACTDRLFALERPTSGSRRDSHAECICGAAWAGQSSESTVGDGGWLELAHCLDRLQTANREGLTERRRQVVPVGRGR